MLLVLIIGLCVGSNVCDFWMKVLGKRICLFHMLALLFHRPDAEDPEALRRWQSHRMQGAWVSESERCLSTKNTCTGVSHW